MTTKHRKKDSGELITKSSHFQFDIKSVGSDGIIEGYGSKWDFVDSYGEAVKKGAFTESLQGWNGQPIPMLWQHRAAETVGVWKEYAEDNIGLKVRGQLNLETQRGREGHSDIKIGAVKGLSIGYYEVVVDSWEEARKNGVRNLHKLDLREISAATFPALREASIDAVKAHIARGEALSIREFEGFLREKMKLSRSDAEFVAEFGYKAYSTRSQRDVASTPDMTDLAAAMRDLKLAATS